MESCTVEPLPAEEELEADEDDELGDDDHDQMDEAA
jgi:hypothetical protein